MYLSAEQWDTEVGGSICLPPLFPPPLVTTSRESQLKLLVLSYNSDTRKKKEEYIKYFSMVSSCVISLYVRWRWCVDVACVNAQAPLQGKLQEPELLMLDMEVNRICCM